MPPLKPHRLPQVDRRTCRRKCSEHTPRGEGRAPRHQDGPATKKLSASVAIIRPPAAQCQAHHRCSVPVNERISKSKEQQEPVKPGPDDEHSGGLGETRRAAPLSCLTNPHSSSLGFNITPSVAPATGGIGSYCTLYLSSQHGTRLLLFVWLPCVHLPLYWGLSSARAGATTLVPELTRRSNTVHSEEGHIRVTT